jgi:replicative DNA helicase
VNDLVYTNGMPPSLPANVFDAPYDEQLEKSVLGGILIRPELMRVIDLEPGDFFMIRHQYFYEAFKELHSTGTIIDRATVRRKMQDYQTFDLAGGDLYISELMNATPSVLYVTQYAEFVKRDAVRRRLLQATDEMREAARDKELSVEEVIASAQAQLTHVRSGMGESTLKKTGQLVDEMFALLNVKDAGVIPTGFRRLDDNLGGGVRRGNVSVFAAPSGAGKTWAAMNMAVNVARIKRTDRRKMRVLYFTIEMTSQAEFNPRLLSILSHVDDKPAIPAYKINAAGKYIANTSLAKRYGEVIAEFAELDFMIDEKSSVTPSYVRDKVLLHRPDLVVIDYLTLMRDDERHYSNHAEYSAIIRTLKEIAKESGTGPNDKAAFVVLSQLNRESIKSARERGEPPYKEALKESGDIENHAAAIVMLWQDDDMEDENILAFGVRKNRFGPEYAGEYRKRPPAVHRDPQTGKMLDVPLNREVQ